MLRTALAAFARPPAELDEAQLAELKAQVARGLAIEDAVLGSDMAQGITVADTEVAAALRELQARYPSKDDFLRDLARNSLDKRGLRQALGRGLRVAAVLERIGEGAPAVTEDEVRDYYDRHRHRFAYPETREARHILVTINEDYPENRREGALRRIRDIARQIGEDTSRFGELAETCSECPTAMQAGRLGRVRPGQLYPELDAALFAMPEGGVAGPVETEVGLHLLYCESVHAAGELDYAQAAPRIRERLQAERIRRHQQAWIATLTA